VRGEVRGEGVGGIEVDWELGREMVQALGPWMVVLGACREASLRSLTLDVDASPQWHVSGTEGIGALGVACAAALQAHSVRASKSPSSTCQLRECRILGMRDPISTSSICESLTSSALSIHHISILPCHLPSEHWRLLVSVVRTSTHLTHFHLAPGIVGTRAALDLAIALRERRKSAPDAPPLCLHFANSKAAARGVAAILLAMRSTPDTLQLTHCAILTADRAPPPQHADAPVPTADPDAFLAAAQRSPALLDHCLALIPDRS
jgi:hypothetical protein